MLSASPDPLLLLHNPPCANSRAARALLDARGVAYHEWRYQKSPLSRLELGELAQRLGRPDRDWTRMQEATYATLGVPAEFPNDSLLDAMASHPDLRGRPILVRGQRTVVDRPLAAIRELLG